MKKAYLFLLCAAISLGLVTQAYAATNLLRNSSFETVDAVGNFAGWQKVNGDGEFVFADTEVRYAGTKSVKVAIIEMPGGTIDYYNNLVQTVNYPAGVPLNARVYIKPGFNPMSNARAGMIVTFLDGQGREIPNSKVEVKTGGTSNWRALRASIPLTPAGTAKVSFTLYVWAARADALSVGGAANFDAAYLAQEYKPVPLNAKLLNGGFENGVIDWVEADYPSKASNTVVRFGLLSMQKKIARLTNATGQLIDFYSSSYQDVACTSGKKVVASTVVKTEFLKPNTVATLRVYCYNASGTILRRDSKYVYNTTDWKRLTITIPSTPAGTARLRYVLYVWGKPGQDAGKSAYFDGSTLTITTPAS